jgi:hypothetical protein
MKHQVKTRSVPRPGTLLLLAVVVCGVAPPTPASEFEYWPKVFVTVPINEQWWFSFEEKLSFAEGVERLDDYQTDLVVTYLGLADWLGLGLGYKAIFERDGDDWPREDRPYLNVAVKAKLYGFGVTNRSRLEYRMPQDETDFWRYRHKLTVTSPVTFTPLKIQPYTADEVFYSFDGEGFSQYRLYGGVYIPLHKEVRLELFYLWKLDKEDDGWQGTNVLGSWVYFQF